jgi:hypothetical protein
MAGFRIALPSGGMSLQSRVTGQTETWKKAAGIARIIGSIGIYCYEPILRSDPHCLAKVSQLRIMDGKLPGSMPIRDL